MSDLHESLSRLLDDELPGAEAEALRRRIDAEPEVRAAWEALQAAVSGLEGLPMEVRPPAALDARVAGGPPVVSTGRGSWAVAAFGVVALAAAVLLGLRTPEPSTVVIGAGSSEVEGAMQVLVGDVVVDLDGRARIDVEPSGDPVRGAGQEVDMNNRTAILAGLAGAAITVTVYEGRAAVSGPDSDAVELEAGASHTVPQRRVVVATPDGADVDDEAVREAALRQRVEELTQELASIEDELATERFAGRLRDAELQRIQGVPSEWGDDVPDALRPDAFEANVLPLTDMPGFTVEEIDCSEYPCVAALRYDGDDQTLDWGSEVVDRLAAWSDENLDDASLTVNKSVFKDDEGESRFLLFGMHDGDANGDVGQRTGARMQELGEMVGQAPAGEEDVDITP